jgi:2-haloacid dehalogenase
MAKLTGISACVFDAYGTLFDTASAVADCPGVPEALRAGLAALWREKQVAYSWLRNMQRAPGDFWQVTGDALDFALARFGLAEGGLRAALLARYLELKAFAEVPEMLGALRGRGFATAILSNGSPDMLAPMVRAAGLAALFDQVISATAVGVFKTDPRVYQLAVERLGVAPAAVCFVSSNGWDAYAASAFGFRVVWCNRGGQVAERLPGAPDVVVSTLAGLAELLG